VRASKIISCLGVKGSPRVNRLATNLQVYLSEIGKSFATPTKS
jgi:hypothetical protein